MPRCSSFKIRPSWSTLSKALEKSKRMAFVVFEAVREVVDGGEELGYATAALSESMLCIVQNVKFVQMFHDITVHNMF